jgi:hypothetical protein
VSNGRAETFRTSCGIAVRIITACYVKLNPSTKTKRRMF